VLVTQVVSMDMTQQDGVDTVQPGIAAAPHRTAGVVQEARAVGVLEDQRSI
jgi:hypothetical protein